MKDEELAKEYAEEFYDEYRMTRGDIENAFLAGLKAGRPQWHDLRKDPNDLPKGNGLFVIYWKLGTIDNYMVFKGSLDNPHKDIIAWCEIV